MKFAFAPESKPLDGYTIKRAIHRGGFGEVYYALSDAGKEVALKLLRQNTDVELRGVTQCLNLKHPNLVNLFDIKTDEDGDHWIIMEYVAGKTLDEILSDYPQGMPLEKVSLLFEQICKGLSFLHDRGIVHRDMKPANLFVEDDMVKIGDIGLSKFITQSRRSAQTQSVGTVYYMAPEVAHGRYGHEVDTYALGIILYELLTGCVPFEGESTGEILMKHLTEKPDLNRLPEAFRPVIARALEKDPHQRTNSVNQFWNEFQAATRGNAAIEIPAGSFKPHSPAGKQSPAGDGIEVQTREQAKADSEIHIDIRTEHTSPTPGQRVHVKQEEAATAPVATARPGEQPLTHEGVGEAFHNMLEWYNSQTGVVQALLIFAVLFVVFGTGLFPVAVVAALFAGVFWGCYALFKYLMGLEEASESSPPVSSPPPREQSRPLDPLTRTVNHYAQHVKKKIRHWTDKEILRQTPPETKRHISLVQRMTELSSSLGLSAFYVTVFSCLYLFISETSYMESLPVIFFLGSSTLLTTWAILIGTKITEGRELSGLWRRVLLLPAALLVGSATYGLSNYLMVSPNFKFSHDVIDTAMTNKVGDVMLVAAGHPTWDAYLLFFAGLFLVRGWWGVADSYRRKKLKISSILWSGLLSGIWVAFFAFPLELALFWSVVGTASAQLASTWTPPRDRLYIVEDR